MTPIPPPSTSQELLAWAECHAPDLTPAIPEAVCDAERIVTHSLAAALRREGLAAPGLAVAFEADVGFERAVVSGVTSFGATIDTTGQLLQSQACLEGATDYQRDVANAVLHLALTLLRQRAASVHGNFDDPKLLERCRRLDPVSANLALDRTNAFGHNVHPLSRLRRGFDLRDAVRYAAECLPDRQVALRFVAVRTRLLQRTPSAEPEPGRHLDQILMAEFPSLADAYRDLPGASEHSLVPVHPWQFDHVLTRSYRRELDSGDIIALDARLPTTPTTSLRTLVCEPGVSGSRWAVKTAINVRLTSTRRDISVATTTDSPMIGRTVGRIVAGDRWLAERVGVITEVAGTAFRPSTDETDAARVRGLSAVLREDFSPLVGPGEVAISGSSLTSGLGQSLLERAVETLAREYGVTPKAAAGWFLQRYADLFASSAVVLLAKYGIGIEGHLQNTLLVLGSHCEPERVLLRDFGGVRIHLPRLARAGYRLAMHSGSLTLREEIEPVRRKAYYSCLQANMAEIVLRLTRTYGLGVDTCWKTVWAEIRRGLSHVQLDADPDVCEAAEHDRTVLSAPKAHQRVFVRLALDPSGGDRYAEVPNPLSKLPAP